MGFVGELAARRKRENAEALAKATREAEASGKEPFDLARFEALLNRGSQARREQQHRERYYIFHPELRTLEEYARLQLELEPWEDCR
jgi:hypothetical protein